MKRTATTQRENKRAVVLLIASGNAQSIERVHRGGAKGFAKRCRQRAPHAQPSWTSKSGDLRCELQTFDFGVSSVGEFRRLMYTLHDELGDARRDVFLVSEPEYCSASANGDAPPTITDCQCSLTLCDACIYRGRSRKRVARNASGQ